MSVSCLFCWKDFRGDFLLHNHLRHLALVSLVVARHPSGTGTLKHNADAADQIIVLNTAMNLSLGHGLEVYIPTRRLCDNPELFGLDPPELDSRPLLKLTSDQVSTAGQVSMYLWDIVGLRGLTYTDPLHREWNDAHDGVRHAGMAATIAKVTLIANVNHGPWMGQDWLQKKAGAFALFAQACTAEDDFFKVRQHLFEFDRGTRWNLKTPMSSGLTCWTWTHTARVASTLSPKHLLQDGLCYG